MLAVFFLGWQIFKIYGIHPVLKYTFYFKLVIIYTTKKKIKKLKTFEGNNLLNYLFLSPKR